MNIAARAFTWGYDLFHPHFAVCWHYYAREGQPRQWDDQPNDWGELDAKSKERARQLFGYNGTARVDLGKYGFGPHRTLQDYEQYVGVEFGPVPKIHQSLLLWDDPVLPGDKDG